MKTFRRIVKEEVNLSANVEGNRIDIEDSSVRDQVNSYLNGVTAGCFLTPYIALERVTKVLANYHIFLPRYSFMSGDSGAAVFPVNQFGTRIGMRNDGQVVTKHPSSFHVYFEYRTNDEGKYDVFCEIVDDEDLKQLMSDVNDELEEAVLAGPETGPRKKPGADSHSEPDLAEDCGCSKTAMRAVKKVMAKLDEAGEDMLVRYAKKRLTYPNLAYDMDERLKQLKNASLANTKVLAKHFDKYKSEVKVPAK